ncbi:uncharacterized protein LOC143032036 [Oratosquilla oratoria]|uniref:uncharacterized protein LOC143032036 n=1 Tax=Oratosquilla oratoria TaxID=337810 RepID=UPI003F770F9C
MPDRLACTAWVQRHYLEISLTPSTYCLKLHSCPPSVQNMLLMELWSLVVFISLIPVCHSQSSSPEGPGSRDGGVDGSFRNRIVQFQNNSTQEGDLMADAVGYVLSTQEAVADCSVSIIAKGSSSFAASFVNSFVDILVRQERSYQVGDLGGRPLLVLSFNHPPSVFSSIDASGFLRDASGIDIKVVRWLGLALNFVPVFRFSGPEMWGDLLENGSYTGIVGRISRGDAELGVGNLFVTASRSRHITYSQPYDFERACFLTPAPRPMAPWMALTFPFTPLVWAIAVACLGVLSVLVPLFGRALLKKDRQVLHSPSGAFLLPLAAFTNQSFLLPRRPPMQVLVSVIILCGFVVTIFFSCNLTAFLTVTAVEKPLTRISQIVESDLLVGGFSNFWLEIFSGSSDDNVRSLAKKYFTFFPDIMPHLERVASREVVLIENSQHLEYLRTTFYMDSRGRSPLRLMEECSHPHGIGALLTKYSPLKPAVDKVRFLLRR